MESTEWVEVGGDYPGPLAGLDWEGGAAAIGGCLYLVPLV